MRDSLHWLLLALFMPLLAINVAPPAWTDWLLQEQSPAAPNEIACRRLLLKERIVLELLDGRQTLLEAAASFRDLNETLPNPGDRFRTAFAGGTDAERLCRQVITWAYSQSLEHATATRAARLHAELREHLRRFGTVHLP